MVSEGYLLKVCCTVNTAIDSETNSTNSVDLGARIAQLVEQAPIYRGLLLDAAAAGSTPTCGPLLHVIPPLAPLSCLQLSYQNKS